MQEPELIAPPEPGIYYDIPLETYLAFDAFSQSKVVPMQASPAHLQARMRHGLDTKSVRLGSLTDTLVFEPDQFLKRFAVRPGNYKNDKGEVKPWNGNATVCREMLEQLHANGKVVITNEEYQRAMQLKEAVRGKQTASNLLSNGRAQVTIIWDDPEAGVRCKGRLDWLEAGISIVDFKTCRLLRASIEEFPRHAKTYGYHIQSAMYTDGVEVLTGNRLPVTFVVVETDDPYAVGFYQFDTDSCLVGRKMYKRAMFTYRACKQLKQWPGYSEFVEIISIPDWAIREELGEEAHSGEF